jgi:hypothetical protein
MAFLRFTRDKRGYEHFCLVQPTTNRRGKVRTRILYWFRTPPNVKVGRQPFDEALRQTLEAQNPGVEFDWQRIVDTPIPSADAEKWRERRRVERAERAARLAAPDAEEAGAEPADGEVEPPPDDQPAEAPRTDVQAGQVVPSEDQQRRRRRRRGRRGRPERAQGLAPTEPRATVDEAPATPKTPEPHEPQ